MLTIFLVLGLIKMIIDQHKEDKFFKKFPIEEWEKEIYKERPPDS